MPYFIFIFRIFLWSQANLPDLIWTFIGTEKKELCDNFKFRVGFLYFALTSLENTESVFLHLWIK